MSETPTWAARASELSGSPNCPIGSRPIGALPWMAAAFLVSLALAAIVLAIAGAGEHGTALALRPTARWCFLFGLMKSSTRDLLPMPHFARVYS